VIVSRWWVPLLLLALTCGPVLAAPAHEPEVAQATQLPRAAGEDPVEDESRRKFEHDQQKKANEERFQKVKEDTEKLVQLSNELKEYVGKANEHTLSLDVVKKAEEIERLAKSVKDKMRAN
jgi:hypothetical protein